MFYLRHYFVFTNVFRLLYSRLASLKFWTEELTSVVVRRLAGETRLFNSHSRNRKRPVPLETFCRIYAHQKLRIYFVLEGKNSVRI